MRFAVKGCGDVAQIVHIRDMVEHAALGLHALVVDLFRPSQDKPLVGGS